MSQGLEHDIADGLADRLEAARQRALAHVQGTVPRLPLTLPGLRDNSVTDLRQSLVEQVASYGLDPLGFLFFAFPWGEAGTELSAATGPREWQRALRSGAIDNDPELTAGLTGVEYGYVSRDGRDAIQLERKEYVKLSVKRAIGPIACAESNLPETVDFGRGLWRFRFAY
jgi:hypothetical protein